MYTTRRSALALLLGILCVGSALAQQDVDDSRSNAIVKAIEKAGPAVVSVNVIEIRQTRDVDPWRVDFWDLFAVPRRIESVGSGFIFDDEGHILTNYHVVENASRIKVTLPDGQVMDQVEYVGGDERTDIAVLRLANLDGLPNHIPLGNSEDVRIGEWAIAIGNPFGGMMRDPQPTVSVGVISANHRRVSRSVGRAERLYQDMIQTDAAINPGNSGGPLVNARGEVIGVNTLIFSQSGGSVGLGFAIPINRAYDIAKEIITYGHRRDPWPGFETRHLAMVRPELLQSLKVSTDEGAIVLEILKKAPAYKARLRPGDVITKIGSENVSFPSDIDFFFWSSFVGDEVELTFEREGKEHTITFPIEEVER